MVTEPVAEEFRILIVDDEPTVRRLYSTIIRHGLPDLKVDTAINGIDAVDSFREKQHRLIIMDVRMPLMDGIEAFHEIDEMCTKNKWKLPKVVFCTGFAPPHSLEGIIQEKGATLLQKPATSQRLVAEIRKHMEG